MFWHKDASYLRWARPLLVASFITLLIAGPWLTSGYLFGTDWPGPRHFRFPAEALSSYLLQTALAVVSRLIGGEATGKVFVLVVLFAAALTAYEAAPVQGFIPRAAAASIYVLNPFVYGRLHYGQLFLLAGFAILPWAAAQLRRLLLGPSLASALMTAASFVVLGILSIHIFLIAAVLAAVMVAAHALWADHKREYLKQTAPHVVLAAAVFLVASSYWLLPILMGRGPEGAVVAGVGAGDLDAYAAVPDRVLGLLPNLLGLYGFWAENTGRFTSMKTFVLYWPVVFGVIILIAAVGVAATLRHRRSPLSPWVVGLVIAGLVGLVLEMGVSQPVSAGMVRWLDASVVPYRGMRDAGKWAALLALVYSQLFGLGTVAILDWLTKHVRDRPGAEWVGGAAAGLLVALPLYYGNGLLFGAHGEIAPSQYPAGWYAADRVLAADPHAGRTLFLPWHEYLGMSFVRNQNAVIACPAPTFFSVPVLASTNPEVHGIAPPTGSEQVAITKLVTAGASGDWGQTLAAYGVKYILVAREVGWQSYAYLDDLPGLVKVGDYGSILLYRDTLRQ